MKRDKLKKLIKTLAEEVKAAAKKVGPDFEKERIHDFRVAVKSLRALIRLEGSLNNQTGYQLNSDLKEIYHISGSIRDAQLELEKIKHMDLHIPGYPKHLEGIISDHREKWERCFSKKILLNTESAIRSIEPAILTKAVVGHFLSAKLAAIARMSQSENLTDDELHSIRKQLKDIYYIQKIVPAILPPASDDWEKAAPEELKEITDKIGSYNDDRIFMEHIRDYTEKSGDRSERKLKKFTADMTGKLKDRKKEISEQVKEYVSLKVAG